MERKIGEIFRYKGKTLEVVKSPEDIENRYCTDCYFEPFISCTCVNAITGHCSSGLRKDKKDVIFKEVQK
ncbi:MAG: hypothetical protein ACI4SM_03175 [Candidatus Gastranaerophilaceae bacterium]